MNSDQRGGGFPMSYCRLTSPGGSECGTCECSSPRDCKLKQYPRFDEARATAIENMRRHFGF